MQGDVDETDWQRSFFCAGFGGPVGDCCSSGWPYGASAISKKKCPRVLIIEDNVDAAESLRDLFMLGDRVVEVAYDGISGVARAERFHPDLVMCDIGLPGMDGFEVARTLRDHLATARSRIVAWTGYARPEDLRRCAAAGFNGYMTKPLTREQLTQLLSFADHC